MNKNFNTFEKNHQQREHETSLALQKLTKTGGCLTRRRRGPFAASCYNCSLSIEFIDFCYVALFR